MSKKHLRLVALVGIVSASGCEQGAEPQSQERVSQSRAAVVEASTYAELVVDVLTLTERGWSEGGNGPDPQSLAALLDAAGLSEAEYNAYYSARAAELDAYYAANPSTKQAIDGLSNRINGLIAAREEQQP